MTESLPPEAGHSDWVQDEVITYTATDWHHHWPLGAT